MPWSECRLRSILRPDSDVPIAVHSAEPRFIFLWNHKVASRSLRQTLREAFPQLRIYHQASFRPFARDAEWPRFLVVRNPWARAASCFKNKCRGAIGGLVRNGVLEPCQRHLLRELGMWPCRPEAGADRLASLGFDDFVSLLPGVREGNSHFRLQIDVMPDAAPAPSRVTGATRAARALVQLARTHYRTPRLMGPTLSVELDRAKLEAARGPNIDWLRMEDLPAEWSRVEQRLGRSIDLPWLVRTAQEEDWRELYTAELYDRVRALYRPDFELFGYGHSHEETSR